MASAFRKGVGKTVWRTSVHFWNSPGMSVLTRDVIEVSTARHAAADGRLRQARLRAKLSQADIARALGVTEATVSRWESGTRRPRRAEAQQLAALLRLLEDGNGQ